MASFIYEYKCVECGQTYNSRVRADKLDDKECSQCPCILPLQRVWGFSHPAPMQEHYNGTVNKMISSDKQFDEELKRMSHEASLYTGVEARYERVDSDDTKAMGVTAEGLEYTNRDRVSRGMKPIDLDKL